MLLPLPPSLNHKYPQMKQVLNFPGYGSGTHEAFRDPQENFTASTHMLLDAGEMVDHISEPPKMGRRLDFGVRFWDLILAAAPTSTRDFSAQAP